MLPCASTPGAMPFSHLHRALPDTTVCASVTGGARASSGIHLLLNGTDRLHSRLLACLVVGQSNLSTVSAGCGPAGLTAPNQASTSGRVTFVAGDLAVTDSNNNRILMFYTDPNAVGIGWFGVVASSGSSFFAPRLLASEAAAGQPFNARVTALDFLGQVNTTYVGTIGFKSMVPNAILPGPYAFTLADAGVHDFNVTFFVEDIHILSVYDINYPGARGADPSVVVAADDPNYILVAISPYNLSTAQQANLVITAYDMWNNVATIFTGTVTFSSSDPNATLPPHLHLCASGPGYA